jgi:primosomal protein N' (replication factor Y)
VYADIWILSTPIPKRFTYKVPEDLLRKALPGYRVIVPFGSRTALGIISKIHNDLPDFRVKNILDIADNYPLISEEMAEMADFISSYYGCPMGVVLENMIPDSKEEELLISINPDPALYNLTSDQLSEKEESILHSINEKRKTNRSELAKIFGWQNLTRMLHNLESFGLIKLNAQYSGFIQKKDKYVIVPQSVFEEGFNLIMDALPTTAVRQRDLIDYLIRNKKEHYSYDELGRVFPSSCINTLVKKKIIHIEERDPVFGFDVLSCDEKAPEIVLNKMQAEAVSEISASLSANKFSPFLLFGVTGSGKTQVYIDSAKVALSEGKGILLLVPEIALTPQLFGRIKTGLGTEVALIHSAVSPAKRRDQWFSLKEGKIKVAVGARSAIFAPVQNLGLIIVDEEHDSSFKQSSPAPYYNARDLALVLGRAANCAVVLGSATPSLESYFNALTGKYRLLEIPERAKDFKMPSVKISDMRKEREKKIKGSLSRLLSARIKKTLSEGNKVILLLNRRGYSSYLQCNHCGFIPKCPDCSVTLTYHVVGMSLNCHICGHEKKAPDFCPECGASGFRYMGRGTQKIEEEIKESFGEYPIFRMDRDSTKKKGATIDILETFRKSNGAILLGTQMVAKGLDFPMSDLLVL